jgi:hypothetical protein
MPGCGQTREATMATFRLSLWRPSTEGAALADYWSTLYSSKLASG